MKKLSMKKKNKSIIYLSILSLLLLSISFTIFSSKNVSAESDESTKSLVFLTNIPISSNNTQTNFPYYFRYFEYSNATYDNIPKYGISFTGKANDMLGNVTYRINFNIPITTTLNVYYSPTSSNTDSILIYNNTFTTDLPNYTLSLDYTNIGSFTTSSLYTSGNIQFLFFVELIDDIIISPSGSSNVKSFITSIASFLTGESLTLYTFDEFGPALSSVTSLARIFDAKLLCSLAVYLLIFLIPIFLILIVPIVVFKRFLLGR